MDISPSIILLIEKKANEIYSENGWDEDFKKDFIEEAKKGCREAILEERTSFVTNLLLKANHSLQEIAEFTDSSVDFVTAIKNNLSVAER